MRVRGVCAMSARDSVAAASCSERSPLSSNPAGERLFESVRRLLALVVEVGLDIGPFGRKQEAPRDMRDRVRLHEFPVGEEGEAVAHPVEHDPPAGPVFVFEATHEAKQAGVRAAPGASPALPDGVMAVGERQKVAIGLRAIERDAFRD